MAGFTLDMEPVDSQMEPEVDEIVKVEVPGEMELVLTKDVAWALYQQMTEIFKDEVHRIYIQPHVDRAVDRNRREMMEMGSPYPNYNIYGHVYHTPYMSENDIRRIRQERLQALQQDINRPGAVMQYRTAHRSAAQQRIDDPEEGFFRSLGRYLGWG